MKYVFIFILLLVLTPLSSFAAPPKKWKSEVPKVADEPEKWQALQNELLEHKLYYGALASAQRRLMFFRDLPTKEDAYKVIIQLIDLGYPYSANDAFIAGDLDSPVDANFDNNYNLYKAIINNAQTATRWAKYYFEKIDRELFVKYHFYQTIYHYQRKNFKEAKELIYKILRSEQLRLEDKSFVKKVARTLARIYFEEKDYKKSFEIYDQFLLKTNPSNSNDWLEAAWNLYYLEDYEKALGYLYNVESKSVSPLIPLDKYVLRSLVYREYCDTDNMAGLLNTFEDNFEKATEGIRTGESLNKFPVLGQLDIPENKGYHEVITRIQNLERELPLIDNLDDSVQRLGWHLYESELKMLKRKTKSLKEAAVKRAAKKLMIMYESLRFLSFDVAREKYNPDKIFQAAANERLLFKDLPENKFQILWTQYGDYWRDERKKYKGIMVSQCLN